MHLTGPPMTGSPYVISLRTDIDEFTDSGVLNYQVPMGIYDKPKTPKNFTITTHPNPFNAEASISFALPDRMDVDLSIYDITGRKVSTLIADILPAGEYTLCWRANDFPSGTYFAVLRTPDESVKRKLLLVK